MTGRDVKFLFSTDDVSGLLNPGDETTSQFKEELVTHTGNSIWSSYSRHDHTVAGTPFRVIILGFD
jgi:hypothetical protein